ncbi:MAG: sigma 54-interacting transcriptional regulator [Planctomycetota bacterium]
MTEEFVSQASSFGEDAGNLEEALERIREKVHRYQPGTASALEDLSSLDEMIRRGARTEQILSHVLSVLSRGTGIRTSGIARSSRGRWKLLASRHLPEQWSPAPPRRDRSCQFHPLVFRGETFGTLFYRKPGKPADRAARSLIEILATRAAEALHHDQAVLRSIREQKPPRVKRPKGPARKHRSATIADDFSAFVGIGNARTEVIRHAHRAAQSDVNVLLVGETGTGKEILARAIHAAGARKRAPFVTVPCPSLPSGILEAELFGHERGAFSGADRSRKGLILAAEGGTLFLDRIDELAAEGQAALLRVLEERTVRPVGGIREHPVDFRLVCSADRDLEPLIHDARFRADLRHRIEGVTIRIPPLSDRKEDIPVLLEHLAGGRISISTDAMGLLMSHNWPGNVRELRNVVEALATGTEEPIDEAAVRSLLERPEERGPSEREMIEEALASAPSVIAAARRLGIGRATIYRKMQKYGIAGPGPAGRVSQTVLR